jgi:hypothetical protein
MRVLLSEYRVEERRGGLHIVVRGCLGRLSGMLFPYHQLWDLYGLRSLLLDDPRNRYQARRADEMCSS